MRMRGPPSWSNLDRDDAMTVRRLGKWIAAALAATALLALPAGAGAANLASGFDLGDEGWRIRDNHVNWNITEAPEWVSSGGNPGGFIRVRDAYEPVLWQAQAPLAWRGNKSADYGGGISFQVRHAAPDLGPGVSIHSYQAGLLSYDFAAKPSGWRSYSAPLSEADQCWTFHSPANLSEPRLATRQDFLAVLGDIDELSVRAELGVGIGDVGELDNIRLSEAPSGDLRGCAPPPDSDGDGTPDENDACPTQFGIPPLGGCPPPSGSLPAVGGPPVTVACEKAKAKLVKARGKLKKAGSKKQKAKARQNVKKLKAKLKKVCA
jgi:hypothetical protein